MIIRPYQPTDRLAWCHFVENHPESHFFHKIEWLEIISKGSGQNPHFWVAEDDQSSFEKNSNNNFNLGNLPGKSPEIIGILPVFYRYSLLFGRAACSIPFGVYGGCLAKSADVALALMEYAASHAFAKGLASIELKQKDRSEIHHLADAKGWMLVSGFSTFIRPIAATDDRELLAIPRKQRAVVRKSLKNGLTVRRGVDQFDQFYRLYACSVKKLGTPVFPKKMLEMMVHVFGDKIDVLTVRTKEDEAIASCLSFFSNNSVMPYYAGSVPAAKAYAAHDFMYFDLMREGRERDLAFFDFGRSRDGTGAYNFKKNWGFTPQALPYLLKIHPGQKLSKNDPAAGIYKMLVPVWQRLPQKVANFLGPFFSKNLG